MQELENGKKQKKKEEMETQVIDFLPRTIIPAQRDSDTGASKHVIKSCHIKSHHVV